MKKLYALIVVGFALWFGTLWLLGSFAISTAKAASGQCDTRLGVEFILAGDWFCDEKGAEHEDR